MGLQYSPALFPDKVGRQLYIDEINDAIAEAKKVAEKETRIEAPVSIHRMFLLNVFGKSSKF